MGSHVSAAFTRYSVERVIAGVVVGLVLLALWCAIYAAGSLLP